MSFDQFASVHEDIAPNTADEIKYEAYPTAARFHKDTKSFVRVILGPVGGGKTTACIMEILSKAITQERLGTSARAGGRWCDRLTLSYATRR